MNVAIAPAGFTVRSRTSRPAAFLTSLLVAQHEPVDEPGPAIDHQEREELEGERDRERAHHHHAHGEQDVGDDEMDGDEGQIEKEAELEGLRELRDGEGRDQDDEVLARDILARLLGPDLLCGAEEERPFGSGVYLSR